jgi:hypothetical protein
MGMVVSLPVYSGGRRASGAARKTAELRFPRWEIEENFRIMQENINNFQASRGQYNPGTNAL